MGIYAPWLPDWMGDEIFIDPYRVMYPFLQITRPFLTFSQNLNMVERRAMSNIDQAERDGGITADEAAQARNKQGVAWDKAYQEAQAEFNDETPASLSAPIPAGDVRNGVDLITSVLSPSLPLSIAYNLAKGKPENISLLPISRFINTVTSMATGGEGWNPESALRQALGWPTGDRFKDNRMDFAISNLVGEGKLSTDEARRAMIDRPGRWACSGQRSTTTCVTLARPWPWTCSRKGKWR
jgi:hypothetical protein